jgi:hypothetical protein
MSDVRAAYKALNREQQAIVESHRVTGRRSPDEWLQLLGPVADFDAMADAARLKQTGAGFWERRFARKHDVPNGLRLFALPLLPILREDCDLEHPVELSIDLSGFDQGGKEQRKSDAYKRGRAYKIVDTFYDDTWIEGRARFVDGALIEFAVTDHVRSSARWQRSASGKIKRKKKDKKKTELAVTVTLPKRNYAPAGEVAIKRSTRKESVRAGEDRTVVKLNRIVQLGRMDAAPDIELLLELLAAAYERVDPARRKKL